MKNILLVLFCSIGSISVRADDSLTLRKIFDNIMLHGICYEQLRVLCKDVGHRLSGSPQAAAAVEWGVKAMKEAGADSVWLQPVWVPRWVRGTESLEIKMVSAKGFEKV